MIQFFIIGGDRLYSGRPYRGCMIIMNSTQDGSPHHSNFLQHRVMVDENGILCTTGDGKVVNLRVVVQVEERQAPNFTGVGGVIRRRRRLFAGLHRLEFGRGVRVHSLVAPLEAVKQPAQGAFPRPVGSRAHGPISSMAAPTLPGALSVFHPWRAIP
jgi:hypothetical protein